MLKVTIQGSTFSVPQNWSEVSVRQYDEMCTNAEHLTPSRLLSILTGIDYITLQNADCGEFMLNVFPALTELHSAPDFKTIERKDSITINGISLPVIKDPGKERIGQKLLLTSVLGDGENVKMHEVIPYVVAVYYAPKLHPDGIWDETHVEKVREWVLDMSILEAVAESNFFLTGYMRDLNKSLSYTRRKPKRTKSVPELKSLTH